MRVTSYGVMMINGLKVTGVCRFRARRVVYAACSVSTLAEINVRMIARLWAFAGARELARGVIRIANNKQMSSGGGMRGII